MEGKDKYMNLVLIGLKWLVKILIVVMSLSLVLGSVNLIYGIYLRVIEPPYLMLEVTSLFEVFNLVLIVAVGYELIKSLIYLITSNSIPAKPIIQIAIIAVANKIITIDIKHSSPWIIVGMAILILSLGATYYFLRKNDLDNSTN